MKTSLAKALLFFSMAFVAVGVPSLPNLVFHDRGVAVQFDMPGGFSDEYNLRGVDSICTAPSDFRCDSAHGGG